MPWACSPLRWASGCSTRPTRRWCATFCMRWTTSNGRSARCSTFRGWTAPRSPRGCTPSRCATCSGACRCSTPARPNWPGWACVFRPVANPSPATRSCWNGSSATWCRTRCATPPRVAQWWWRAAPSRTSTSRSGTPGWVSPPNSCRGSFRSSTKAVPAGATGATGDRASAWAWPSCGGWCGCWATGSKWRRYPGAGRCSVSASHSAVCRAFRKKRLPRTRSR